MRVVGYGSPRGPCGPVSACTVGDGLVADARQKSLRRRGQQC